MISAVVVVVLDTDVDGSTEATVFTVELVPMVLKEVVVVDTGVTDPVEIGVIDPVDTTGGGGRLPDLED